MIEVTIVTPTETVKARLDIGLLDKPRTVVMLTGASCHTVCVQNNTCRWLLGAYDGLTTATLNAYNLAAAVCENREAVTIWSNRSIDKVVTRHCSVCGWALSATRESGCVEGDCSYRGNEAGKLRHFVEIAPNHFAEVVPC